MAHFSFSLLLQPTTWVKFSLTTYHEFVLFIYTGTYVLSTSANKHTHINGHPVSWSPCVNSWGSGVHSYETGGRENQRSRQHRKIVHERSSLQTEVHFVNRSPSLINSAPTPKAKTHLKNILKAQAVVYSTLGSLHGCSLHYEYVTEWPLGYHRIRTRMKILPTTKCH